MKTFYTAAIMIAAITACAQSHTETITRTFSFEKKTDANTLIIANINGSVQVEGYSGSTINVRVEKTIVAKTEQRLAEGKQRMQLGVLSLADTLVLFVEGENQFGKVSCKSHDDPLGPYGYQGCSEKSRRDCNCDLGYSYKMNFVVQVPGDVNVVATTINEGGVTVSKVNGIVHARNVNGAINLADLKRESTARTINGNVDIAYAVNPLRDCRFYSLNGNINAFFQKGLSASASFESFNGDFYTNIDHLETLPPTVDKTTKNGSIRYKVNNNRYKVGKGGAMLDFETFNGNVYLQERAQ